MRKPNSKRGNNLTINKLLVLQFQKFLNLKRFKLSIPHQLILKLNTLLLFRVSRAHRIKPTKVMLTVLRMLMPKSKIQLPTKSRFLIVRRQWLSKTLTKTQASMTCKQRTARWTVITKLLLRLMKNRLILLRDSRISKSY